MTFRSQDDAEVRTRRSLVGVFALVGDVDANGAELAGLRKSTGASLDGVAEVTSAASATLAGLEARTDKDLAVQAAAAKEVAKLLADRDAVLEEMHADVHESVDPLVSSQHTRTHIHTAAGDVPAVCGAALFPQGTLARNTYTLPRSAAARTLACIGC